MSKNLKAPTSVGVIISTYNNPKWLELVLWGYTCQTYSDFELLIADDGSKEETRALIERFQTKTSLKIKHIWQEDNGFQKSQILNKAIVHSVSEYLIFTDQDCIPRKDFVEKHLQFAKTGYFLSGGYFKLPMSISNMVSKENIEDGSIFKLKWLFERGLKKSFKCSKLWNSRVWSAIMNFITPAAASWNGCNASGWKADFLVINGFNQDMQYGGQDREFGERLWNAGLHSKQIRYTAICLHLDHKRPYKTVETMKKNKSIRKETKTMKRTWTPNGITNSKGGVS